MKRIIFIQMFLLLLVSTIFSLELQTYDVKIIRIGVVDMDKLMNEHPYAKKVQQDIVLYKENKTAEITTLEKEVEELLKQKLAIITEIEQLKTQFDIIKSTQTEQNVEFSTPTVQTDTQQLQQLASTIETKQKNLDELNRTIEEKNLQIKQKKQEIETEVVKMKQKSEVLLYAELYKIIQQIAQEEGLNVIINKSGILYGEPDVDITEKVIKKLK